VLGEVSLWADRVGYSIRLTTTNYDDFLERALESVARMRDPEQPMPTIVRTLGNEIDQGYSEDGVNIMYLHGYLPRKPERTPFTLDRAIDPVFSEEDYYLSLPLVSQHLRSALSSRSVLIVGSSLSDASLLHQFLETRHQGHKHYALVPIQDRPWRGSPELATIKTYIERRFAHFDVEVLFPDFFGQVGQFIQEVSFCSSLDDVSTYPSVSYGQRLQRWWRDWCAGTGIDVTGDKAVVRNGHFSAQGHHHKVLSDTLDVIRELLKAPEKEVMKLEIWLRWAPRDDQRKLKLWASSIGTLRDLSVMREDVIKHGSDYASVRAFCHGRPMRMPDELSDYQPKGRWAAYLCCPIWLGDTRTSEVPVAVVTLATRNSGRDGCLGGDRISSQRAALALMREIGVEIARPATTGAGS
jgi:hypothetical protein